MRDLVVARVVMRVCVEGRGATMRAGPKKGTSCMRNEHWSLLAVELQVYAPICSREQVQVHPHLLGVAGLDMYRRRRVDCRRCPRTAPNIS